MARLSLPRTRGGTKNAADVRLGLARPKRKQKHKLWRFVRRDWWLLLVSGSSAYFMQPVARRESRILLAALAIGVYFGGVFAAGRSNRISRRKMSRIVRLLEEDAKAQAERLQHFEAAITSPLMKLEPVLVPVPHEEAPEQPVPGVSTEAETEVMQPATEVQVAVADETPMPVGRSRVNERRNYQTLTTRSHAGRRISL